MKLQNETSPTQNNARVLQTHLRSYMEFTGGGAHGKKRLREKTESESGGGLGRRRKDTVFRALYVSSHLIFGTFYEVGTIFF